MSGKKRRERKGLGIAGRDLPQHISSSTLRRQKQRKSQKLLSQAADLKPGNFSRKPSGKGNGPRIHETMNEKPIKCMRGNSQKLTHTRRPYRPAGTRGRGEKRCHGAICNGDTGHSTMARPFARHTRKGNIAMIRKKGSKNWGAHRPA